MPKKNHTSCSRTTNKFIGSDMTRNTGGRGRPPQVKENQSPDPVSVTQRTDALLRGLVLILEHHDAPDKICNELTLQVHSYLDTSLTEMVWLKRCKHLLTYPLAKYLKNEAPPEPDQCFKPTGSLRSWMKARLNAFNRKNTHLWYSWFQSKRCTLPLSESIIEKTYDTHFDTLSKEDSGCLNTIKDILNQPIFLYVLNTLRDELLGSFSEVPSFDDVLGDFDERQPSTSACFESTRSQGGQQMRLRGEAELSTYDEENFCTALEPQVLHSMVYRPWVYSQYGILTNFCSERTCAFGQENWTELRKTVARLNLSNSLCCTIQAVLEPNKVRVISKGNALPYYSCKPLQKNLHSAMKRMGPFRLIGRPFLGSDLLDLTRGAQKDWKWFSIDYSAATDGLSWRYSGKIFEYLISSFPEQYKDLAMAVLGPHDLYYPDKKGKGVFRGKQRNGQLMGSILSFPILCLANLGVYLLSTQGFQRGWSYRDRLNSVLINGDDMVYAAPESFWDQHVNIGRAVGLEMSVGKAYIHREYLNINSQSIHCPLHLDDRSITLINFLNVGLFFGQHKVQGKSGTADAHLNGEKDGYVVNINTILNGTLLRKRKSFLVKILETKSEVIQKECLVNLTLNNGRAMMTRNLFIPENLGGMGVIAPPDFRYKTTKSQLYLAHGMIRRVGAPFVTGADSPLPGFEVTRFDKEVIRPWTPVVDKTMETILPFHRITFPTLRLICRQGIRFYGPYKDCLVV